MLALKAVLLGFIQGLCAFLPISGTGHTALAGRLLGFETDLFFIIILHLGTCASAALYFRSEIMKCLGEIKGLVSDGFYNLKQVMFHGTAPGDSAAYRNVSTGTYRKLLLLVLCAVLPSLVVAAALAPVIETVSSGTLSAGMGFFITALVLFVSAFSRRNRKGPREARLSGAAIIGLFNGASVFPGVSGIGMSYSAGLISGFSRKFSRLFAFLIMTAIVPCAFIFEGARCSFVSSVGVLPSLLGFLTAFVTGSLFIKRTVSLMAKQPLKFFSVYCFCMGTVSVLLYLS